VVDSGNVLADRRAPRTAVLGSGVTSMSGTLKGIGTGRAISHMGCGIVWVVAEHETLLGPLGRISNVSLDDGAVSG
jgi:hypothetical protein